MNNRKYICRLLGVFALMVFGLSSCTHDKPLSSECDIIGADLVGMEYLSPVHIEGNSITFYVKNIPDSTAKLSLKSVVLSLGAKISPDPTILQNFFTSEGVVYTVTSEDGKWTKGYTVRVVESEIPTDFSFETHKYEYRESLGKDVPSYYIFYETHNSQQLDIWASGNGGYQIVNGSKPPEAYPTSASVGDGCDSAGKPNGGTALKLVTRDTGPLGASVGKPIAAGSLFLGSFDGSLALSDALGATKFGVPFNKNPISIEGWYKYTPGATLKDKDGNDVPGTDEPSIFAVLYEPTPENPLLDGANILTSNQIVARAEVKKNADTWATTSYQNFEAEFEYEKTFDPEIAINFGYNIAIVFSSSKDGAYFTGAVDSTLYIDEVKLNTVSP